MNYESILEFSLIEWLKRSESWKYALLLWLINITALLITIGLAFLFFGELISMLLKPESVAETLKTFITPTGINTLLAKLFIFIPAIILIAFISFLLQCYVTVLIQLYAFRCKGISYASFSFIKFIKLILLAIVEFLAIFFYSFNFNLRIVLWLSLLAMLLAIPLGFFSPIAFILLIAILPYGFAVIYNSYRLSMSPAVFLHKDIGIVSALKNSWEITRGKVFEIFAAFLLVGIISAIIIWIITIILSILFSAILLAILQKPEFLPIIQNIAQMPAQLIITPVQYFIGAFLLIAIYSELITKLPITPKQKQVPPQKPKTRTLPTKPETLPITPRKKPAKTTVKKK